MAVIAAVSAGAYGWLQIAGFTDESLRHTIRGSVYAAFSFYILVLVARPLQQLLRTPFTAKLLRNRRLLGVGFAAAMTGHLALIACRFNSQPELEFRLSDATLGIFAYTVFYLMFITSFDGPAKALGPKRWKWLHRLGLLIAAAVFAVPGNLEHAMSWDYLKFGIPFVIAVIIRITAWQLSRRRDIPHSPG